MLRRSRMHRPNVVLSALATLGLLVSPAGPSAADAAGQPVALEFQVQPGGGPENAPWPQQPVVRVVDANGDPVTSSHAAVLLRLVGSGAVLFCQEGPVPAIEGVARFNGCGASSAGTYRLRATAFGVPAALSEPFTVGPPGPQPAVVLRWNVGDSNDPMPLTATAAGPIWFDVRVDVTDALGRPITSGPASTTPVTLSVAPNWEGATISCPDGLTVAAVAGVVRFEGCSISTAGHALHLVASAEDTEPVWTGPMDVWPAGTPRGPRILTLEATPFVARWGESVGFSLAMDGAAAGQQVAGRSVHIQASDNPFDPDGWQTVADAVTDARGRATVTGYRPSSNRYYRALFDGAGDLGPAISLVGARVIVRQLVAISPGTGIATKTIPRGTTITFRATVRPARPDAVRPRVEWRIWHWLDGRTAFSSRTVTADAAGNARLPVTFSAGTWRIEARALPTPTNANSVVASVRFRVP